MFCKCYSLEELNLGENFVNDKVTNAHLMFFRCRKLKNIFYNTNN